MSNTIGCSEPECPGVDGFVEVSKLLPDRKMMETMGRRIEVLEDLILRAGDYFTGCESGETEVVQDVMVEAVRIRGKKRRGDDQG